jgi:NTP pyrophosphatase (non-canonical NTP hydrolase)
MITFENYQKGTDRAIPEHDNKKDAILHWCIGLSEEVGEVMSVIKHHYYGGENPDSEALVKEIGDVLWYTAALCRETGIDMDAAAELNMAKLMHRFPNEQFDNTRSANRHELEKKFSDTDLYKELMRKAVSYNDRSTSRM